MGKWLAIIAAFLLALPGCGTDEPTRLNTFTPLTSIVITSVEVVLPVGVSTQLTAMGNFSGLYSRDITREVTWSSDQPGVADFPLDLPSGRVKAIAPGTTTITANLDGVTSAVFALTVSDAFLTALTVTPLLPSLPLGLTQAFTAQGTFSGEIIPRDLTKDVTWSSSDATVASISDVFANKGKATSLKVGSTVISAQFDPFTESTTLTVTAATLSSIAVTPVNPALLSLSTQTFSATGTYSDQSTRDITADTGLTWGSSDPAVATATGNIIKALTPGLSAIKATLGTVSGTSNLTVTGGSLQSIALTLAQAVNGELINGTRSRVTARGIFNNGTSRDITGAVILTDDSANVSVTPASGNLAWVQTLGVTPTGTPAKIFATYGSTVTPGESLLTVTAPPLVNIAISPPTLTLASGTSSRLSLTGTFSSNNQDLTPTAAWSSADPAIAIVGTDGRVHAVTAGITVVTATYIYGGQTATDTTSVEVVARTLQSLTISAVTTPATIIAGTEKEFKVTATYNDGFEQDVTADVTWTTDNLNVAKFSDQLADPGLVVAVDAGTATLTATFGGLNDTESLVVSR